MTIHKEGYTAIALCILFIFVLNAVTQFYFPQAHGAKWIIYILSFILFVIVLAFFRNPSVIITADEKKVLCPADGKVIAIEETEESAYLKDRRIKLSLSASPFDVHVNRSPVAGVVNYLRQDGNDTTTVTQTGEGVLVLLKQTIGALSHGISYINEGQRIEQGQQISFIRSGSATDVYLPIGSKITVEPGQTVTGGRTVLAELPEKPVFVKPAPAPVKVTKKQEEDDAFAAVAAARPVKNTIKKKPKDV